MIYFFYYQRESQQAPRDAGTSRSGDGNSYVLTVYSLCLTRITYCIKVYVTFYGELHRNATYGTRPRPRGLHVYM